MKTENTIPDTIPAPLADALARMMREIDEAFAAPSQPGKERLPYMNALVAVSRFARFAGLSPAWERLHELAQRLDDLNRGRVDPLLTPKAGPGTTPDSDETWNKRVLVLVAFKALGKAGMNQKQAAGYIAKKFPGLSTLMRRGAKLEATILRWQRDLNDAQPGQFLYRFGSNLSDHCLMLDQTSRSPEQWREAADNLLDKLLAEIDSVG